MAPDFVAWLEAQAPSTGPSGIGKDHYNWMLRNVHLIPMTWEDEVRLLRRELDRAHASLHLEEQRNRVIPVSLIRWQLTGKDDEIRALLQEP